MKEKRLIKWKVKISPTLQGTIYRNSDYSFSFNTRQTVSERLPSVRVVRVSGGGKAARTSETELQNLALSMVAAEHQPRDTRTKKRSLGRFTRREWRVFVCLSAVPCVSNDLLIPKECTKSFD